MEIGCYSITYKGVANDIHDFNSVIVLVQSCDCSDVCTDM